MHSRSMDRISYVKIMQPDSLALYRIGHCLAKEEHTT